ncbi:hypothetical protein BaRGS_00022887 [Batillaria attramentaria]|uniref:Uncharacterized protein n=1 Tax=Batillaria attramentaria TaxID=370345 RepID=A0ABD0KFM5_9CAEN
MSLQVPNTSAVTAPTTSVVTAPSTLITTIANTVSCSGSLSSRSGPESKCGGRGGPRGLLAYYAGVDKNQGRSISVLPSKPNVTTQQQGVNRLQVFDSVPSNQMGSVSDESLHWQGTTSEQGIDSRKLLLNKPTDFKERTSWNIAKRIEASNLTADASRLKEMGECVSCQNQGRGNEPVRTGKEPTVRSDKRQLPLTPVDKLIPGSKPDHDGSMGTEGQNQERAIEGANSESSLPKDLSCAATDNPKYKNGQGRQEEPENPAEIACQPSHRPTETAESSDQHSAEDGQSVVGPILEPASLRNAGAQMVSVGIGNVELIHCMGGRGPGHAVRCEQISSAIPQAPESFSSAVAEGQSVGGDDERKGMGTSHAGDEERNLETDAYDERKSKQTALQAGVKETVSGNDGDRDGKPDPESTPLYQASGGATFDQDSMFKSAQGHKYIRLLFEAQTKDGHAESVEYPHPILEQVWHLLNINNKVCRDDLEIIWDEDKWKVRRISTVAESETAGWFKSCTDFFQGSLNQVESAFFMGHLKLDVEKYLKNFPESKAYLLQRSQDGQVLQLFAFRDVVNWVLQGIQLSMHSECPGCRMILKLPFEGCPLEMFESLGFQKHCSQRFPGLSVQFDLYNKCMVLVAIKDYRAVIRQETIHFIKHQVWISFDLHRVTRWLLVKFRAMLLKRLKEKVMHCWWKDDGEKLQVIAPSADIAQTAVDFLLSIVWQASYPIAEMKDWHLYLKGMQNKYFLLFDALPQTQDVLVAAVVEGDTAHKIDAEIRAHFHLGSPEDIGTVLPEGSKQPTMGKSCSAQDEAQSSICYQTLGKDDNMNTYDHPASHSERELASEQSITVSGAQGREPTAYSGQKVSQPLPSDNNAESCGLTTKVEAQNMKKNKVPVLPLVREFLEDKTLQLIIKGLCSEFHCFVHFENLKKGFIEVQGENQDKVKQTLEEFFFHQTIAERPGEEKGVEQFLKKLSDNYPDQIKYKGRKYGTWDVCIINDEQGNIQEEVKKFLNIEESIPVPCYVIDFFAHHRDKLMADLLKQFQQCGQSVAAQSVDIRIVQNDNSAGDRTSASASTSSGTSDTGHSRGGHSRAEEISKQIGDEKKGNSSRTPALLVSTDKGNMHTVRGWIETLVSELETREETLELCQALFLEGIEAQEQLEQIQSTHTCQVGVLQGVHKFALAAKSRKGQRLFVCHGNIVATDCDVLVLPLLDRQKECPPKFKHILQRGLIDFQH